MYVNTPHDFHAWAGRLQRLWSEEIPLARAMGARVERLDADGIVASAPLERNVNPMGTAFGGGLQALATLAGWAVTLVLAGDETRWRIVIGAARMRFVTPVRDDLVAVAGWPPAAAIAAFRERLKTRGRARLDVRVTFGPPAEPAAEFEGRFVALRKERDATR